MNICYFNNIIYPMIDSAVFSRNTILDVGEEWKTELGDS